jgi:adenylate cyclase class 2
MALKERLSRLAACCKPTACQPLSFEKDDAYWVSAAPATGTLPKSGVRIRRERTAQDGGEARETILATYKSKEVRDGIEVNDEHEFAVSDAEAFAGLLASLGLEPGLRKHKQGWAWAIGKVHAELCEVSGQTRSLGWFLELEILAEDADPETVAAAREELLALLDRAGLPRERIEGRYYSELLGA